MDLSFTNSTSHVIYRTDIDYDGVHQEPLSSSRFWKRFAEMKIEGYSSYIKFFEPRLKEFEEELQSFKDPTEESWVKSIKAQLDQEKAQLDLFKAYRNTFGSMTVELRALESKHQNDDTTLCKMKSDLKLLEEDCKRINKKLAEQKAQLEGKLTKLENLVLISSPLVQQKADKVSKMAATYDKHREEREEKISSILKKSDDIFQIYERVENERTNTLLDQWKVALANMEKNFKEFRRAVHFNRGGYKCDEIDVSALVDMIKRKRRRILRVQDFQKSGELISKNITCVDFFHERGEPTISNSPRKVEVQRMGRDCGATEDSVQSETEVKPFNVEDDTEETSGPMKRSPKHKSCSDDNDSTRTKNTEFSQPRPLPQPEISSKNRPEADETLQNEQDVLPIPTTFLSYVVKIKTPFQKEVEGQMSVKKGEKVKVLQNPIDGYVLVKKRTKLTKRKQGLIPVYTFDIPADRAT